MAMYYDIHSQEKTEAECFERGNIDNFIAFLSSECCDITVRNSKAALVKFPFGHTKELMVLDGDYVIKGREIPNTLPKLHEFHVMSARDFKNNYISI